MSVFKLNPSTDQNSTKSKIVKNSDTDFVIITAYIGEGKLRRLLTAYKPMEILPSGYPLDNVAYSHHGQMSLDARFALNVIKRIEQKTCYDFYLVTKPEGVTLQSFAIWLNNLTP